MTSTNELIKRNLKFSKSFDAANLPILPKLRSVIITCGDSRVDPSHTLGLELGDSVVIRNNGGRVTKEVIEELAVMALMVAKLEGTEKARFEVIIIQHTQCGAERFADVGFQQVVKQKLGIDVSDQAISDHQESILKGLKMLQQAPEIPNHIIASGYIYDVANGQLNQVSQPAELSNSTF